MGIFSKTNIDKAKALAEKNKAKIASGVAKATETIDKKTGGKHSDKLKKVDDAAKKFGGTATEDAATDETADETPTDETSTDEAASTDETSTDEAASTDETADETTSG